MQVKQIEDSFCYVLKHCTVVYYCTEEHRECPEGPHSLLRPPQSRNRCGMTQCTKLRPNDSVTCLLGFNMYPMKYPSSYDSKYRGAGIYIIFVHPRFTQITEHHLEASWLVELDASPVVYCSTAAPHGVGSSYSTPTPPEQPTRVCRGHALSAFLRAVFLTMVALSYQG